MKSAKPGKPPPAEPREARRAARRLRRRAQRRATRFAEGGKDRPHNAKLSGGTQHSPQKTPAKRVLPAPRAGGQTIFAFLHWENPLRPGTRNCPFPIRAGEDSLNFRFSLPARHACGNFRFPTRAGAARAIFAVQSPRAGHRDSSVSRLAQVLPKQISRYISRADDRFPGELRSPAPASDEAINFR